jgi:fructokinase
MDKTVVAFGEVLWDLLPSCTVLGGAPFNFTYRVNSLGDRGLMASRLGRDNLGQQAFDRIALLGLDTRLLQWDEETPTGTVQVSFDARNNPEYAIVPNVAYDRIELTDALVEAAEAADCLCFGTLSQRASISRATLGEVLERASASLKFLDINLRRDCFDDRSVDFSLGQADILKLNEDEAEAIGRMLEIGHGSIPDFCKSIIDEYGLRCCLVTLGDQGAFGLSSDGQRTYTPGYKVNVADSLGSGDAFSAGFVHRILHGASLQQAVAFGNVLGAVVATQTGATVPVAGEDLDRFAHRKWERSIHPAFLADVCEDL